MKHYVRRHLITALTTSIAISVSTQANAAAFQLWEQDAASMGNYHAGYAVGHDASTAFYNPAGLTQIQNQQLIVGGLGVATAFKFRGIVTANFFFNKPQSTVAQGGTFSFIPFMHYAAPISDRFAFGLSVDVPFGLKTDYGTSTYARYATTLAAITVIDVSPALAFKVMDCFSIGAGVDIAKAEANLTKYVSFVLPANDTRSKNELSDTGYGYHVGALYNYSPTGKIGLSYHSKIALSLTGTSKFTGPIPTLMTGGPVISHGARASLDLPAYTALSFSQKVNPQWNFLATAAYTQWNSLKVLRLRNAAGLTSTNAPTKALTIELPQHYRNVWNFAVGTEFTPCDPFVFRAGIGYDQSPVKTKYRVLQIPDSDRYVIALGGHYQATPTIGVDVSWLHVFARNVTVNSTQVVSSAIVNSNGRVNGGADVFAGEVTWDIV